MQLNNDWRRTHFYTMMDPGGPCCAVWDWNQEGEPPACTCPHWWLVMNDMKGAVDAMFFAEFVRIFKAQTSVHYGWEKVFEVWDRYAAQKEFQFEFV